MNNQYSANTLTMIAWGFGVFIITGLFMVIGGVDSNIEWLRNFGIFVLITTGFSIGGLLILWGLFRNLFKS